MSSFEDNVFEGYTRNTKHFDKLCEQAKPILGKVTQCGIIELDKSGNAFIAANRPDFGEAYLEKKGYLLDSHLSFMLNGFDEGMSAWHTREEYELMHLHANEFYGKHFDIHNGFSFQEKEGVDIRRIYWFASDTPEIYNSIVNNLSLFKKFLKFFKEENQHIIKHFKENKFDIAGNKENYFVTNNNPQLSERERMNSCLHTIGVLDEGANITPREWQCIEIMRLGKSASKTAEILGISRRTVEGHFDSIKNKLKINSKSEIIETLE